MINKTLVILALIVAESAIATAQEEKNIRKDDKSGSVLHSSGFTPLHEAARLGSLEAATRLIEEGANVNARVSIEGVLDPNYDFVNDTPIDVATAFGHLELVKLLRKHGGRTATETEATRVKRITWGKPVDGLQIGVALAIEENALERHPTYLATYVRNSGLEPRTFLTSVHTSLDGGPKRTSLLASRLTLYKLGGGDLITLFYQGENYLLPRGQNRKSHEPNILGKDGDSYTIAALSDESVRKHSITLMPGQQVGPVPVRYGDKASWAPALNKVGPDCKSQYGVALMLDVNHPKSPWKGTLKVIPLPSLRFQPPALTTNQQVSPEGKPSG